MRTKLAIALTFASLTVAGCGSMSSSEYSCKGYPEGAQCMSAREVYEATEHSSTVGPTSESAQESETTTTHRRSRGRGSTVTSREVSDTPDPVQTHRLEQASRQGHYMKNEGPVPIRTPAKVMRAWIDTYEDTNGDLHNPGVVYTEVEQRAWSVGQQAPRRAETITPLDSRPMRSTE